MAMAPEQVGIGIRRYFTREGDHPYEGVAWERRDARIANYKDGTDAFFQPEVEFPQSWSLQRDQHRRPEVLPRHARYRGTGMVVASGHRPGRRKPITEWGVRDGYFTDDAEAESFRSELKFILVTAARSVQLAGVVQHRCEEHARSRQVHVSS